MSPIFVRPAREQFEHDRLIRFLLAKYKRRFEAAINVGDEQVAPFKLGQQTLFPDVLLTDGRKTGGVVEVETGESVNNLEALAEWVPFSRARVPFHLYVPVQAYDAARRLCEAHGVNVTELWTYRGTTEGFDLVRMAQEASPAAVRAEARRKAAARSRRPAATRARKVPPAKKTTKTKKAAKPARRAKRK